jgi:hypothetical protein
MYDVGGGGRSAPIYMLMSLERRVRAARPKNPLVYFYVILSGIQTPGCVESTAHLTVE